MKYINIYIRMKNQENLIMKHVIHVIKLLISILIMIQSKNPNIFMIILVKTIMISNIILILFKIIQIYNYKFKILNKSDSIPFNMIVADLNILLIINNKKWLNQPTDKLVEVKMNMTLVGQIFKRSKLKIQC